MNTALSAGKPSPSADGAGVASWSTQSTSVVKPLAGWPAVSKTSNEARLTSDNVLSERRAIRTSSAVRAAPMRRLMAYRSL